MVVPGGCCFFRMLFYLCHTSYSPPQNMFLPNQQRNSGSFRHLFEPCYVLRGHNAFQVGGRLRASLAFHNMAEPRLFLYEQATSGHRPQTKRLNVPKKGFFSKGIKCSVDCSKSLIGLFSTSKAKVYSCHH